MNLNTAKTMKLPSKNEILKKLENDRRNRNISPNVRVPANDSSDSVSSQSIPVINPSEIEAAVVAATDRNERNRSFCLYFISIFCPCFRSY